MKKKIVNYLLLLTSVMSLSACNIFDLITPNSSYTYPSYTDSEYVYENRNGYENHKFSYLMEDVGYSADYPYLSSHKTESGKNPKILVIPVAINGYELNVTDRNLNRIKKAFSGSMEETSWQSVSSFYSRSSFGKLSLDITVAPSWYACGKTVEEIYQKDIASRSKTAGVEEILNNATKWYKNTYSSDATELDSNKDGYIDAVWLIYSAPNYQSEPSLSKYETTLWAYTFWSSLSPKVSSPVAGTFGWASYDFMLEGYGSLGIDAHTYIHETGHMLGLDDYYDYNGTNGCAPMGAVDMMDANIIDHNAFSKTILGWTYPFVINQEGSITIKPSCTSGDVLLIPTSKGWNGTPFDEYMMVEFYTPENLNQHDSAHKYSNGVQGFQEPGIRIYHVDARLVYTKTVSPVKWVYTDTLQRYSMVAHSNTPNPDSRNYINPEFRLIQEMDATYKRDFGSSYNIADDTSLFHTGDTFSFVSYRSSFPLGSSSLMNNGYKFEYKITVDSISSEKAVLSFSKS